MMAAWPGSQEWRDISPDVGLGQMAVEPTIGRRDLMHGGALLAALPLLSAASVGRLAPHPRLYIGREAVRRARRPARDELSQAAAAKVTRDAERYRLSAEFDWPRNEHNAELIRARFMQLRVLTLIVRWHQTSDRRFRDAAVAHIQEMGAWQFWSWDSRLKGLTDPKAEFDLSYGENAATFAIAYDLLFDDLSAAERDAFAGIARRWVAEPFLARTSARPAPWWFEERAVTNWTTVCAGGAGMVALAFAEHLEQAGEIISRAERSIGFFVNHLGSDGAWDEGVGYWNYGMRYLFMYLLSHEAATGTPHPHLQQPKLSNTLRFTLDFTPGGTAAGFGDFNSWEPLPFHYAAARRARLAELPRQLDTYLTPASFDAPGETWSRAAERLLLVAPPASVGAAAAKAGPVAKLYPSTGWALLADRMPDPNLYVAVRGGSTKVNHSHLDLLSFNLVAGGEALIDSIAAPYLDTTFGPRRFDIFELDAGAKNVPLVNGVGIPWGGEAPIALEHLTDGTPLVRVDGTAAMGLAKVDVPLVSFCARAFLLVNKGTALIVLDRFELPSAGRVEARFQSSARLTLEGTNAARITGARATVQAAFAATVPCSLHLAQPPLTDPHGTRARTMVRWCTNTREHRQIVLATVLSREAVMPLAVSETDDKVAVRLGDRTWHLSSRLNASAGA